MSAFWMLFGAGRIQTQIVKSCFSLRFFSTEAYLGSHLADFKSSNNRPSGGSRDKKKLYTCHIPRNPALAGNDLQVHEEITLHLITVCTIGKYIWQYGCFQK